MLNNFKIRKKFTFLYTSIN